MLLAILPVGADPATAASLDVTWASSTEADLAGYRLRMGTVSGQYTQTIEAGLATSVEVGNLAVDVTYFFAVYAFDEAGNESHASPEVSARIPSSQAPLPILDSVLDLDSQSIYLLRGRSHTLVIRGRNIQNDAAIDLGPGSVCTRLGFDVNGDFVSYVLVAGLASAGRRTLTLINPDQGRTSVSDAVAFVKTPDTNFDCSVDVVDLNALARSWNVRLNEPEFAAASDLDGDDYVGPEDLTIFVKFLGRQLPGCP